MADGKPRSVGDITLAISGYIRPEIAMRTYQRNFLRVHSTPRLELDDEQKIWRGRKYTVSKLLCKLPVQSNGVKGVGRRVWLPSAPSPTG